MIGRLLSLASARPCGTMRRALVPLACLVLAATPAAARDTPRQAAVRALFDEATKLANDGRFPASLEAADRAVALADRTLPARDPLRYLAMRRRVVTLTFTDDSAAPAAFEALSRVAGQVYGKTSFEAVFAHFKGVQWGYNSRLPGATLAELAVATTPVAEVAERPGASLEARTMAAQALAILANNLSLKDIAQARPIAARALALADALGDLTAAERGQTYHYLATIALRDDRPGDAMTFTTRAIAIYEADQGRMSHHLVDTLGTQAIAAQRLGDGSRTEALLRRAVGIVDARPDMPGSFRGRALMNYGRFLADRGRDDLAYAVFERAVETAARMPPGAALAQSIVLAAGQAYHRGGRYDDALRHLRTALTMTEETRSSVMQGQVLTEMGRTEFEMGDIASAQATAERALAVVEKTAPPGHSLRGATRMLLADLAEARGDSKGAAELYAHAAQELKAIGPDPVHVAPATIRRAAMLARLGRLDDPSWAAARSGIDALVGDVIRQAAGPVGDQARLALSPQLVDGVLDAAWAKAHPVQVSAR
ncbi:tetratricopeptide repeat protein [Sphingomonas sp.]|uniref:tetratricopeptide repeat protein n=1 Tax=Sphingomonas sp. TaxID=28214 RepID=UPI002DD6B060|nr:hypothetical protein [Sphingomonas sp.]